MLVPCTDCWAQFPSHAEQAGEFDYLPFCNEHSMVSIVLRYLRLDELFTAIEAACLHNVNGT